MTFLHYVFTKLPLYQRTATAPAGLCHFTALTILGSGFSDSVLSLLLTYVLVGYYK